MGNMSVQLLVAGIVTYNPTLIRLEENISSIVKQVKRVCVVDNGSENINEIERICVNNKVDIIKNYKNEGIGFALNKIMEYAAEHNALWCITLDQDSISPDNLIEEACKYTCIDRVGEIAPTIVEARTGDKPALDTPFNESEYQYVTKCITSATMTNVKIWKDIGGFDNNLFIDYIDFDYSAKLISSGYKIIRMNNVYLNHELGESEYHHFFNKKIRVANHSSFRKYYICRNIIIFLRRKYPHINNRKEVLRLLKTVFFVTLYEKEKKSKLRACFKGIIDGLKYDDSNRNTWRKES